MQTDSGEDAPETCWIYMEKLPATTINRKYTPPSNMHPATSLVGLEGSFEDYARPKLEDIR